METEFILIVLLCSTALYLGWLLTESSCHALPKHFTRLNFKPFNCRPCMTFHLTWIAFAIVAGLISSLAFFFIGVLCAFVLFLILDIRNNNIIDQ